MARREIRQAGLTLIFDARKAIPQPQLYKALMTLQVRCREINATAICCLGVGLGAPECSLGNKLLQEQFVQAVNSVVLLADKESKLRPERFPGIRVSLKKMCFLIIKI